MDPVSITTAVVGLSGTLGLATFRLKQFIDSVKNVDQNVRDLLQEAQSMKRTLDTLERSFLSATTKKNAPLSLDDPDNYELWSVVNEAVEDVSSAVEQLADSLDPLSAKSKGFVTKMTKTIRFKLKGDDVTHLQKLVHGHTGMLQMAIQMISLKAVYSTPGTVLTLLTSEIDQLRRTLDKHRMRAQSEADFHTYHSLPEYIKLQTTAERLITSANSTASVIAASEANPSLYGDTLRPAQRAAIKDWIPSPGPLRSDTVPSYHTLPIHPNMQSTAPAPLQPLNQGLGIESVQPSVAGDVVRLEMIEDEDEDEDDEFGESLANDLLATGREHFNRKEYGPAGRNLQKGLDRARRSMQLDDWLGIPQTMLDIAACHYYTHRYEEAEVALISLCEVLKHPPSTLECSESFMQLKFEANYLCGSMLFRRRKYQQALAYAKQCVRARRQDTFSQDDIARLLGYALNAQIYRVTGHHEEEANALEAKIPATWSVAMTDFQEKLHIHFGSSPLLPAPAPELTAEILSPATSPMLESSIEASPQLLYSTSSHRASTLLDFPPPVLGQNLSRKPSTVLDVSPPGLDQVPSRTPSTMSPRLERPPSQTSSITSGGLSLTGLSAASVAGGSSRDAAPKDGSNGSIKEGGRRSSFKIFARRRSSATSPPVGPNVAEAVLKARQRKDSFLNFIENEGDEADKQRFADVGFPGLC